MPRPRPLPAELSGRPFSVAEARAAGVTATRLRASDLESPTRGARAARSDAEAIPEDETASQRMERLRRDLHRRAKQIAPALIPGQFYSHDSGLSLAGAPLPFTKEDSRSLHVSARRPAAQPDRVGVIGHRLQRRDPAPWRAQGLPIEHPARLWRQVAPLWDLDDLIAAGDFLVCPRRGLLTLDDLRQELADAGDVAGRRLSLALSEIRVGAETAEETKVRLLLTRAGLPEPELNWSLHAADGRFVARLDMAYPKYRVAPEHDGRTHAADEKQFARDADRWDDVRKQGWVLVRILSHHMRPDPQVAVERVSEALWNAGWRPGRD